MTIAEVKASRSGFSQRAGHLAAAGEFKAVLSSRTKYKSEHFCLHVLPNGHEVARLGIATPKRYLARAVDRNLVRRIARESFRHAWRTLSANDLVLRIVRPMPRSPQRADIRVEIGNLLVKVRT